MFVTNLVEFPNNCWEFSPAHANYNRWRIQNNTNSGLLTRVIVGATKERKEERKRYREKKQRESQTERKRERKRERERERERWLAANYGPGRKRTHLRGRLRRRRPQIFLCIHSFVNNNIGADNSSQILTDLIRFSHSLDQLWLLVSEPISVPEELQKYFNIHVFLHRINVRKCVKNKSTFMRT